MYRIIDERGSGKTSRLMLLAKETGGIIVCSNARAMQEKAKAYGITGLEFVGYGDFVRYPNLYNKFYIDEMEAFISYVFGKGMEGYSISKED